MGFGGVNVIKKANRLLSEGWSKKIRNWRSPIADF